MNRAFRAIRRSDVVALVIEAMACITEQVRDNAFICYMKSDWFSSYIVLLFAPLNYLSVC